MEKTVKVTLRGRKCKFFHGYARVDINDVAIVAENCGRILSLLSPTGIIAIAGIHTYKEKRQLN